MYTPYIERQKWLPWQRPLLEGYGQYLHFVGRPLNPPSITKKLSSRYRSHKAIYSNFSSKIGSHGNDP